jgi:hypothetical protein
LAAAVGAVVGQGRPNGKWHSHNIEARSNKGLIATIISPDAPEPDRAIAQLL